VSQIFPEKEFAGIGDLFDVRQVEIESHLHQLGATAFTVEVEQSYSHQFTTTAIICTALSKILILEADDHSLVFDTKAVFAASFMFQGDNSPAENDLVRFTAQYGVTVLHPYLRAAVQEQTVRSGLPALLLPPLDIANTIEFVANASSSLARKSVAQPPNRTDKSKAKSNPTKRLPPKKK
jgi:hypothetical protein